MTEGSGRRPGADSAEGPLSAGQGARQPAGSGNQRNDSKSSVSPLGAVPGSDTSGRSLSRLRATRAVVPQAGRRVEAVVDEELGPAARDELNRTDEVVADGVRDEVVEV